MTRYSDPDDEGTATKNGFRIYPLSKTLINGALKDNLLKQKIYKYIEKRKQCSPLNIKALRDYQNEDAAILLRLKRVGLFNEQRLGKTPTVLAALSLIKDNINVLIIAPKSTHYQWKQETEKWLTNSVFITNTIKQKRVEAYNKNYKVYITTYETANIDFKLLENKFNCVIVDEAHRLRNYKGDLSKNSPQFTKSVCKLAINTEYVYLLTGTPAPNYAYQIFPILHILYPEIFPYYWPFIKYYFITRTVNIDADKIFVDILDFKNSLKKQELQEFLYYNCIQRKRKEHMQWLPKTDIKIVKLELSKKEKKWYNELTDTWECEELNIDCPNQLVLLQKLIQISSSYDTKTSFILDYLKDYPDEQVIITTPFTSYLKKLHTLIPNSRLMIGESSTKQRGIDQDAFNRKEYNVLLGNVNVIKEGIKLEQGNTIIVVTPSLVCSDNDQLYDRIVPTNQKLALEKNKQQVIKLICTNTIDEYLETQLNMKKSQTEIINNFMNTHKKKGKIDEQ